MTVLRGLFGSPDPVLELVRASTARKKTAELRLRLYDDRQLDDLLDQIRRRFTEPEKFPLFFVNVVRKVTNKRAMVYRATPFRTFTNMDQARGEALYRAIGANVILKKANRLTKLLKTTALKVAWTGARVALSVVTPNVLDVIADDPESPSRIILTRPGDRIEDATYSDWTATTYRRLDWRGRGIPLDGNPDGVNPYGILPFVPLFDRAPDDQFFLAGGDDLVEAQRAINMALVNLWRALELQSHGQAWAAGLPAADMMRTGPDRVIALPTDGKFGFAAPETPVQGALLAIEFLIKQTAVANDLPANIFELNPKAESGAAKVAESRDLIEARADDVELWRGYEARLFEVIKRVVNVHLPGTIPEKAELRVDFGEVTESLDENGRLEAYRRRLDMGIWSPVDVLMDDNPDIRSREDAMAELQLRREESATLGAAFAGPSFQGGGA